MKTEEKKAQHTKGKVNAENRTILYYQPSKADGIEVICIQDNNFGGTIGWVGPDGPAESDARRIVAAWNACLDIPTEALESGVVEEMREVCEALDDYQRFFDQNAREVGRMPGNDFYSNKAMKIVEMARAVLAKAKVQS